MELYFLGTGAGTPSIERNVTSIALNLYEERGTTWLFDCGEGTQHAVLRSPIKLGKLELVFITHLHGDHIFGLPGMLTSRSNQGAKDPLTLIGPPGLRQFVEAAMQVSQSRLDYELHVRELDEAHPERPAFEDERFTVTYRKLEHRIDSYGYRIEERDQPGRLLHEKLEAEGVRPGPVYARIKKEAEVRLDDGRVLRSADYLGPTIPGRTVVIAGDTRMCDGSRQLMRGADVVVHEATFADELHALARRYYHATAKQAAEAAAQSGVGTLILTHISSRYQGDGAQELLKEARAVWPNTFVAHDHWSFPILRAKPFE